MPCKLSSAAQSSKASLISPSPALPKNLSNFLRALSHPLCVSHDPAVASTATTSRCPSDLGHEANREEPYPLSYVPFSISKSYLCNQQFIISPYKTIIDEGKMTANWFRGKLVQRIQDETR
ncbi:hypothetical protein IAR50_002819 [Cryptococcus sp. DSM 104548]